MENLWAVGAPPPPNPAGELTYQHSPLDPSWWERGCCPPPLSAFGLDFRPLGQAHSPGSTSTFFISPPMLRGLDKTRSFSISAQYKKLPYVNVNASCKSD